MQLESLGNTRENGNCPDKLPVLNGRRRFNSPALRELNRAARTWWAAAWFLTRWQ